MNKFKVGDWVRTANGVFQIESIDDHDFIEEVEDDIQLYFTDKDERWDWSKNCEIWQHKPNEWCWVNKKFVKLGRVNEYGYVDLVEPNGNIFTLTELEVIQLGEPFIGQLPSFIKEIKDEI